MFMARIGDFLREGKHTRFSNAEGDAQPGHGKRRVNWQLVILGLLVLCVLAIWLILIPR